MFQKYTLYHLSLHSKNGLSQHGISSNRARPKWSKNDPKVDPIILLKSGLARVC